MPANFEFLPQLILRCPLISYRDYSLDKLDELLQRDWFKLAIYLASPDFYQRLATNGFSGRQLNSKERITLLKYYNRMSFRPTPFGAFSSFAAVTYADVSTNIQLPKENEWRLKLLFDQHAVFKLAEILIGEDVEKESFSSNPTLYRINKEFRYIKTLTDAETGKTSYRLESFEANRFTKSLLLFLKRQPESYTGIINYTKINASCSDADAGEYLQFLIGEQIVLSKHNITILGESYLRRLLDSGFLKAASKKQLKSLLEQLDKIQFADIAGVESFVKHVNDIFLKHEVKAPAQLFYANMERPVTGSLSAVHQEQLTGALNCLQTLIPLGESKALAEFKKQFKARFDLQKIPLLQALDPETGIAYGDNANTDTNNPLLQDMPVDSSNTKQEIISWSETTRLLFQKWNEQATVGAGIVIDDDDLAKLPGRSQLPMPPSMPIMFRLCGETIFIEAAGGASATSLIGRFTVLSPAVKAIADEIVKHEQRQNPGVIFAEINQLSDHHVDNINRRLSVYEYEMTINSPGILNPDKQVQLDDLVLSVVNDELIIESVKLKKRIIPRLSSAYNYQNHQLNLLRFLGDVQHQGIHSNFTFDLETMFPGMPFYPRVTYKQTILCLAKWYLSEDHLKRLINGVSENAVNEVRKLKMEEQWSRYIAVGRSDQQLIFDLDDDAQALFFVDCIKTETNVRITEHLMCYDEGLKDHNEKPMVNQFITILLASQKTYNPLPEQKMLPTKQVREFIPGSKWVYFKIYCSPTRANELLVKKILPVLRALHEQTESWFFIRYIDTGAHIRLRILVKEEFLGNVLTMLKAKLSLDVRYQLIQDYRADVYRRELERYGADIIEDVEKVFEKSSNLIIYYLKQATVPDFAFSYHSIAMVSAVEIIARFFPVITDRMRFAQQMVQSFSLEHKDAKALKFSLDKKYRALKDEIALLLDNTGSYYKKLGLTALNKQLHNSIDVITSKVDNFSTERKNQLAADIIHMHLNRLFPDEQRYQELIVYHCLYKHLQAVIARNSKQH